MAAADDGEDKEGAAADEDAAADGDAATEGDADKEDEGSETDKADTDADAEVTQLTGKTWGGR